MEINNELTGTYTTEYRQYDARLGRWFSPDPVMNLFADQSPYNFGFNVPTIFIDPSGLAPNDGRKGHNQVRRAQRHYDRSLRRGGTYARHHDRQGNRIPNQGAQPPAREKNNTDDRPATLQTPPKEETHPIPKVEKEPEIPPIEKIIEPVIIPEEENKPIVEEEPPCDPVHETLNIRFPAATSKTTPNEDGKIGFIKNGTVTRDTPDENWKNGTSPQNLIFVKREAKRIAALWQECNTYVTITIYALSPSAPTRYWSFGGTGNRTVIDLMNARGLAVRRLLINAGIPARAFSQKGGAWLFVNYPPAGT